MQHQRAYRLLANQNILQAGLANIFIAIHLTRSNTTHSCILTNNPTFLYLINNCLRHPSSQYYHLEKLLVQAIIQNYCNTLPPSPFKPSAHTWELRAMTQPINSPNLVLTKPRDVSNPPPSPLHTTHTTPI
jgi:hypothetical protein